MSRLSELSDNQNNSVIELKNEDIFIGFLPSTVDAGDGQFRSGLSHLPGGSTVLVWPIYQGAALYSTFTVDSAKHSPHQLSS